MIKMKYTFSGLLFFALMIMNLDSGFCSDVKFLNEQEDDETLRPLPALSAEQYDQFETARRLYFKEECLSQIPTSEDMPLFELVHESGQRLIFLGTHHNVPFEVLPEWFSTFLKNDIDEVFMESEFIHYISQMGHKSIDDSNSTPECAAQIAPILDPILNIFSKKISDLPLSDLFCLIMAFDNFVGMDATLSMRALQAEKSVFFLDKPMDVAQENLRIYRARLNYIINNDTNLNSHKNEYRVKLDMGDADLMIDYIPGEITYLMNTFSNLDAFIEETVNSAHEWFKDHSIWDDYLSKKQNGTMDLYDPEREFDIIYKVEERNTRWFNLIQMCKLNTRKLICVGVGHLPDLFERFQKAGYVIQKYQRT